MKKISKIYITFKKILHNCFFRFFQTNLQFVKILYIKTQKNVKKDSKNNVFDRFLSKVLKIQTNIYRRNTIKFNTNNIKFFDRQYKFLYVKLFEGVA